MFVGGPGSGKSNYLFRAWIAIEHETGQLRKHGLPPELGYLHDGAARLLAGNFAPHTSLSAPTTCEIPVTFVGNTTVSNLTVPDVSGEVWNDVYERRQWPTAWDAFITDRCSFVLFVRAGSPHNVKPLDWLTCERLYKDRAVARAEARAPTQVFLVDWLQTLRELVTKGAGSASIPRLSVVVTAWDTVQEDLGPQEFLAREFPLLDQFLRADLHGFEARVFGVSIAGGDLDNDPKFRAEYLAHDPKAHGYSITATGRKSERKVDDVLVPLYWALGHDR